MSVVVIQNKDGERTVTQFPDRLPYPPYIKDEEKS